MQFFNQYIQNIKLYSGDKIFDSEHNIVKFNNQNSLTFEYSSNEQIVRGELRLRNQKHSISLNSSSDFDILDSLELINNDFHRFRIRFKNLSESDFLNLTFTLFEETGNYKNLELPLFPYTQTEVNFYPKSEELYLGESRQFEIISNNIENLVLDGMWKSADKFNYRLVRTGRTGQIFIEPKAIGNQTFEIVFETKRPFLDYGNNSVYSLEPISKHFKVQNSRHIFLRIDERQIIREPENIKGERIHLENNGRLLIGKTYRIEASEEVGSPLIAELFTIRRLTNDKILCDFRAYNNHKVSDGYLFIKDGDQSMFVTNIDIIPMPAIERVSILRNGTEWSGNLNIKPGETIDLKIEGRSLKHSKFYFEEMVNLTTDSALQTDIVHNYKLRLPINANKRTLNIVEGGKNTGIVLTVAEHQKPRKFDFINIDYGEGKVPLSLINQPVLYSGTVKDIVISFDRDLIDRGEVLYGKQIVQIRARLEDKNGNLIETGNIGTFTICPGEESPRHNYYSQSGCRLADILVNNFLSKKTYSLGEWGKIELIVEHTASSYTSEGFLQRIVIYHKKRTSFDVDLSIPAGLFIQKIGDNQKLAPFLTGISFAMVAQFSFYRDNEIQQLLPIKAGVGFLAQNAFNFSPNAERDLGLILITSLYPIKGTNRISFPLYGGFGYYLQEGSFFFLIGPGIRVSF
ncbi:MAG: hypothetical protein KIT33_05185 [Candidatus Kapabacteria bacterium]|nr:hypothetical protein [Candidatus Kapabacteria bacterium]